MQKHHSTFGIAGTTANGHFFGIGFSAKVKVVKTFMASDLLFILEN